MTIPEQQRPNSWSGSVQGVAPERVLNFLALQCVDDSHRWFPLMRHSLTHHGLALGGETGEVQNILKKIDRGDFDAATALQEHKLGEEMADILIYLLNLSGLLGVDLFDEYHKKRTINEGRWGNGQQGAGVDAGDDPNTEQ